MREIHMSGGGTIQEQILGRAVKDKSFRQELLANPRAVLARRYNRHLPETVSIRVVASTTDTRTMALRPNREAIQDLSEAELEAVSGGWIRPPLSWTCPQPSQSVCCSRTE